MNKTLVQIYKDGINSGYLDRNGKWVQKDVPESYYRDLFVREDRLYRTEEEDWDRKHVKEFKEAVKLCHREKLQSLM